MLLLLLFHQQASKQGGITNQLICLLFLSQPKKSWDGKTVFVLAFFSLPLLLIFLLLLKTHMLLSSSSSSGQLWQYTYTKTRNPRKPEESHKVKAAAAATTTTITTTFVLLTSWILPLSSCPGFLQTHSLYTEKTKTKQKKLSQESEEKRKTQLCKTQNTLSSWKPNPKKQQNKTKPAKQSYCFILAICLQLPFGFLRFKDPRHIVFFLQAAIAPSSSLEETMYKYTDSLVFSQLMIPFYTFSSSLTLSNSFQLLLQNHPYTPHIYTYK